VSGATPALIAAAAGVGFGHAIMPDHWVPLALLGRTRGYPLARVARLSSLAGVSHVLVSLLLGAVIVAIGLQFRSTIAGVQDTIVGSALLATGIGFAALELSGRGHSHGHDHAFPHGPQEGSHPHEHGRIHDLARVMVPFGAAASPDLTILPVFLAATAAGTVTAVGSLVVFAAVTISTIVALTLLGSVGGYGLRGRLLDRWGNGITATTLIIIGALVLTGTL